jgi:hypothetical protein
MTGRKYAVGTYGNTVEKLVDKIISLWIISNKTNLNAIV